MAQVLLIECLRDSSISLLPEFLFQKFSQFAPVGMTKEKWDDRRELILKSSICN